jgi:hypothetical protein
MSDLIVIGYPAETTAQRVWDELVKLEQTTWWTWRTPPSSGVMPGASCMSRRPPITRWRGEPSAACSGEC